MEVWRNAIRSVLWGCLVLGLGACAGDDPMAEFEPGERGRVVRVIDGDALVLDTGQSVRLISIEAPARPSRERPGQPYHAEAKRRLEDMALGREVQLYYAGLTRDRYDRALAHIVADDGLGPILWLNAEMVRRGAARVRIYPDTAKGSASLFALETEARAQNEGLWQLPAYQIRQAESWAPEDDGFHLVEAKLASMSGSDAFGTVCELALSGSALRLRIRTAAAQYCQLPEGARVRVRGYIRDASLEVTHVFNLERLP